MIAQVGNQGNVGNQNGNVVNENVHENIRNLIVNGNQVGCSYKEFLACNTKEYDGKGGAVILTCWIEKIESVQDMSGCSVDQKVKYTAGSFVEFCPIHEMQKLETKLWNHAMVGAGHATYTNRFHELARKIRCIRACTHQRPQRKQDQYAVSREDQYTVLEIWNEYNILEDIKRGPYSKKSPIHRIQSLDTPYRTDFQTL
ncbi:hypothetical protein Tco_0404270 [Tanacetum coccineum]